MDKNKVMLVPISRKDEIILTRREWHLIDSNEKVLLNISEDQVDELYTSEIDWESMSEFLEEINQIFINADIESRRRGEYNGANMTGIKLDMDWQYIVAKELCNSSNDEELMEDIIRFRDSVLNDKGIEKMRSLTPLDWYEIYTSAV